MKLTYNKKSKDPIYYIQQGVRNGKKTTTKTITRIGKHSELLQITDDPLAYAMDQVRKYNEELKNSTTETLSVTVDYSKKLIPGDLASSHSTALNVGYFFLQEVYSQLNISSFIQTIFSSHRAEFDPDLINRFLTFDRVISPGSKLSMISSLDSFFEKPDFSYQHVLRFMSVLSEHFDEYIEHLFLNSQNIVERDTSVCYFDCTNFYFEIEREDPDYIDPVTGELIRGSRKYGPSKQHQPAPLVEMGLFMDGRGIPISMCITHGSDNEQNLAIPLEEKLIRNYGKKKFIYVADAGLGSLNIRKFNDMGGRAFIVTQSVKKLSAVLKEAVFADFDWKMLHDDSSVTIKELKEFDKTDPAQLKYYNGHAYKVLDVENVMDLGFLEEKKLKNGKTRKVKAKGVLKQRVIVTFSRKMMEYQRYIRNSQIERAKKILADGKVEDKKKGPNDVTRFIRKSGTDQINYELDKEKIAEEEKYDGYYAIATNLDDDVKTIFEINSRRYKIEDCFRVMKTSLDSRPVYHRLPERITAHFMICYTALLIYRLLEAKLDDYGEHFTCDQIIDGLRNMNVVNCSDLYYQSIYTGSRLCSALNGIFDLGLDKVYYRPKDLSKKLKKISKNK